MSRKKIKTDIIDDIQALAKEDYDLARRLVREQLLCESDLTQEVDDSFKRGAHSGKKRFSL